MMLIGMRLLLCFAALLVATGRALASGSGAYRLEVPDAGAAGMGSAFVGQANTPAAVYWNPAGLTQIVGQAVSVGGCLVQPRATYEDASGGESQMKAGNFGVPHMYYVYGTESYAFGLGVMSSWGLSTEWLPDSFARYYSTKATLQNQDYLITGAYRVNEQLSLSLSLDIDDSSVDKQKKVYQAGEDGNLRLKGDSTACGYRIAGMFKLNDQHQFGLMYRSRMEHTYRGKVHIDQLNNTYAVPGLGGLTYQNVFGGSSYETAVVSKSTLPDSIILGYSFKPGPKWTFNFDLEWMNWSSTEEEKVNYPDLTDTSDPYLDAKKAVLNNGNPAPRDWKSALSFSLGTEYKMTDTFRLRGGFYHHESPIPGVNWTATLPDADSNGIATGFGYDINKSLTFDFAWSGLFFDDRKINNSAAPAGNYKQWVSLTYATATYKF